MFHTGMILDERLNNLYLAERYAEALAARDSRPADGSGAMLSFISMLLLASAGLLIWVAMAASLA
jgi:hypothetical protein